MRHPFGSVQVENPYRFNDARFGSHRLVAEEIGEGKRVLDVGCNTGYLKQLAPRNEFFGIDNEESNVAKALASGYARAYQLDLNEHDRFSCDKQFDVIVFADVLEHLLRPEQVLRHFVDGYLAERGKVIISLPNVANASIRVGLLLGNFDYTDDGILDRTHLHLYTMRTAAQLIESSGLRVLRTKFSSNRFGWLANSVPALGGLLGFNLIYTCERR